MGEFRIGRRNAQHSYPEARRNTTVPFAGNFAQGPAEDTAVEAAGTQVPWFIIASGAAAGVHVPITPESTGRIRITAVLTVVNISEGAATLTLQAQSNDVTIAAPSVQAAVSEDIPAVPVPFVLDITLPIGVARNISLLITASGDDEIQLAAGACTIDIQEIPAVTG